MLNEKQKKRLLGKINNSAYWLEASGVTAFLLGFCYMVACYFGYMNIDWYSLIWTMLFGGSLCFTALMLEDAHCDLELEYGPKLKKVSV